MSNFYAHAGDLSGQCRLRSDATRPSPEAQSRRRHCGKGGEGLTAAPVTELSSIGHGRFPGGCVICREPLNAEGHPDRQSKPRWLFR